MYAKVIIRNTSSVVDKFFTYKVPDILIKELKIGHRVLVPFGMGNKVIEGFVFDIENEFNEEYRLKEIFSILDKEPLLDKDNIQLIKFMKKKYLCSYIDCISLFYPKGYKINNYKVVKLIKENYNRYFYNDIYNEKEILKDKLKLTIDEKNIIDLLIKNNLKIKLDKLPKKLLNKILKKLLDKELIEIKWEASSLKNEKKIKYIKLNENFENDNPIRLGKKQEEILSFLRDKQEEIEIEKLKEIINASNQSFKSLQEKGLINIIEKDYFRSVKSNYKVQNKEITLNEEQQNLTQKIVDEMFDENKKPYLLHGVTGSGKTEVYIKTIEYALSQGLDSIVLVPEISLTPQTISRFTNKFGDIVGVYHSHLSDGERHDVYRKVKDGSIRILVGARSALFAPFNSLGVVIIDEFHETSYKSDKSPKYNAIEIAKYMVFKNNITLILGSATPPVDEYYKAVNNSYELLELNSRANKKEMPKIEIVDMKEELNNGNKNIFSNKLKYEIQKELEKNNQIILFLNRRGYSNFVSCRECAFVFKCENCDISLTYHKKDNKGVCHYCGHSKLIPKTCPECDSKYIKTFGVGTQKIEEELQSLFKNAKILRMDRDTTTKKNDVENILNDFKNKKANILIGTQMISKGLDFEDVTLVGIMSGDMILNSPDFKSAETTFQLITQVAGRCGRGEKEGKVILQSYETNHYAIKRAVEYDYINFYKDEIKLREAFGYSPFSNIISVVFSGENEEKVKYNIKKFNDSLIYLLKNKNISNFDFVLGPNPCPISKIDKKFRYQILFKDDFIEINLLKGIIMYICIENRENLFDKEITISIDINPNSIM